MNVERDAQDHVSTFFGKFSSTRSDSICFATEPEWQALLDAGLRPDFWGVISALGQRWRRMERMR